MRPLAFSIFFAVVFTFFAVQAADVRRSDLRKPCDNLSAAIRSEIRAPYKPMTSRLSQQCVEAREVRPTRANLHLLVAVAFYHQKPTVRSQALRKLQDYECANSEACEELYQLLDSHMKVMEGESAKVSKDFRVRATLIRDQARPRN